MNHNLSKRLWGIPSDVFATLPDVKYECRKCRLILRRPVQARCGHRFCAECFKNLVETGSKPCDECKREKIYVEPVSLLNQDKTFADLAVEREISLLAAKCPNTNCDWKGFIKDYQTKHEGQCKFELVRCKACDVFISRIALEKHKDRECQVRTLYCKHCKANILAKDIKIHDNFCTKFPVRCVNCGKKKIPRDKLTVHNKYCNLSKPKDLYRSIEELNEDKKLNALENIIYVLNREVERLSIELENFTRQRQSDKDKIDELSKEIRSLKNQSIQQSNDINRSVKELELYTYNGIFLWKISDFSRHKKTYDHKTAIFSPAFFTAKYSYKVCLRIYLNGDGAGRDTHLSLFFVVMKGPYDELLKWPFNRKVTFMLLSQNNCEHIIDAFRPNLSSGSFQRSITEMNVANGCPLFCPLNKLSDYIKNDVIFIKVIVE